MFQTVSILETHFPHLKLSGHHELLGRIIEITLGYIPVSVGMLNVIVPPQRYITRIIAVTEMHGEIMLWLERPIGLQFHKSQQGFDLRLTSRGVLANSEKIYPIFESSDPSLGAKISKMTVNVIVR